MWIMQVSGSDDAEKNLLDNYSHHQKGGEYECMNTWFSWCLRIIKQGCFQDHFNQHSKVKHSFKIKSRLLQKTSIASKFIQDQLLPQNTLFPTCQGSGNRLPSNVIDY